ncbi:MAG: hypothetical protein JO125_15460, partial [Chloroflexi bacterium]|nr:hypothetical protein [Chloroflexota bacterium]
RYVLQRPGNAQVISLASTFEVISKVGSTMGAIGYADLGSANQASDTVTAININGNAPTAGLVGKGMYPFWAIERMYTRTDSNNPLVSAFITYVTDTIQTNTTFVRKGDMQPGVLSEHSSREGE